MNSEQDSVIRYEIIDIGGSKLNDYYLEALGADFFNGRNGTGQYVSDIFTFAEPGMELWSNVISLPNWYQTREEVGLLKRWGPEIVKYIHPGTSLVDLGSGDVKKIIPLLDLLEALQRPITYYSVDLSRTSIERGLKTLSLRYKNVKILGLWGSFNDAKTYLDTIDSPRFLACFGAEIGNDPHEMAVSDLSSWASVLRPTDHFLLGIDSTQDNGKIWEAYHDKGGVFHTFVRSGMTYTNAILGHEWFKDEDWVLDGEFRENPLVHRFVFTAVRDVTCADANISFKRGDRVFSYESHRNTPTEMRKIFQASGLKEINSWKASDGEYYDFLLVLGK